MAGIGVSEKNNNFRGNDQKERDLAYGDLCLRADSGAIRPLIPR
jgi:hypothetical protein